MHDCLLSFQAELVLCDFFALCLCVECEVKLQSEADVELKGKVMPVLCDFLHSAFVQSVKLSF